MKSKRVRKSCYERMMEDAMVTVPAWPEEKKKAYRQMYLSDAPLDEIRRKLKIKSYESRVAWKVLCLKERPLNKINASAAQKRRIRRLETCNPKHQRLVASEMIVTLEGSSKGDMHEKLVAALGNRYRATKERLTLDGNEVGLYDAIREANRVNRQNGLPLIDNNPAWVEGL